MMLSLFQEKSESLDRARAFRIARDLLLSSLNKGTIPTWENFFQELPLLENAEDLDAIKKNFLKLTEWDFLVSLLEKPATEFFFHSPAGSQLLSLKGKKENFEVPLEESEWQLWLEIVSIRYRQTWNVENPFVSFFGELKGRRYRFTLVHGSTSPLGMSKLVLRSLSSFPHPLDSFGETHLLRDLIQKKANMLIAGSTGSGKTSLLSTLLGEIDPEDHLVVLEDTYEIASGHPHETRFLAGASPQTSLKSYLSYSLRMTPDRIILGEMRSHEVVPFLMAMNTGHKGLMATVHASSSVEALNRVALLFSLYSGEVPYDKVMELLCRNLEYVVFMENKRVKEIIRVLGSEKGTPFYEASRVDTGTFTWEARPIF